MSCVRNLQVSKKKGGGLTMKTLEGVLGVDDIDAESSVGPRLTQHATISTRCAELDQEMTLLLGVSSAIIENVLFCHQEDSNWPLSEPAALKKRFDEIFEVTRYTKALDALRTLRKNRLQDARVDEAALSALQHEKERADQTQRTLHTLGATLAEKQTELDAIDADVAKKTAENQRLYDTALRFREVITRAETLEERLALYKETRDGLAQSTTMLSASDAAVETQLAHLPAQLEEQQASLAATAHTLDAAEKEHAAANAAHERALTAHGEHVAAQRAWERTLRTAQTEMLAIAAKHGLDTGTAAKQESAPSLRDIPVLCTHLQTQLASRARALQAAEQHAEHEARANEAACEQAWQDQRTAHRDLQTEQAHDTEALARLRTRIEALDRDADAKEEHTDTPTDPLHDRHHALETELEALEHDSRAGLSTEIRALEARRDALARTAMASHHAVEQRAILAKDEHTLAQNTAELDEILARIAPDATRLLGTMPSTPSALAAAAAAQVVVQEQAVAAADAHVHEQRQAHDRHAASLDVYTRQLAESEASCRAKEHAYTQHCTDSAIDPAPDALRTETQTAADEVAILQDSLSVLEHAAEFFQRILKQGQEAHVCIGCNRGLPPASMPAFEAHVHASLQRSTPERIAALRADLDAWTQQKARLQTAHTLLERWTAAKDQQAHLAHAVDTARTAVVSAAAALRPLEERLATAKRTLAAVQTLATHAEHACRLGDARDRLQGAVESVRAELPHGAALIDDTQTELADLQTELESKSRALDAFVAERESVRASLAQVQREIHAVQMQAAAAHERTAAREAARQRRAEYAADLEEATAKWERRAKAIDAAHAPIKALRTAWEAAKDARLHAEDTARAAAQLREHARVRLHDLDAAMDAAAKDAPDDGLAQSTRALADALAKREACAHAVADAQRAVRTLETALSDAHALETRLKDNLRYRHLVHDIERVQAELDALDLAEAHAKHTQFAAEYDAARRAENELNGAAAHLRGELRGLEAEMARRQHELDTEYHDVHARYIKQLIHMKVAAMANHDLETYSGALHQAILQFHAIKVEEVNQTLDYLWKKTYQGADIDTILIRADTDGKMTANGLRSYQYRVCMVKDGVELEMRGRCSAGQKVLACILVRLALADSFGAECGFMALDEPTTNLDRENVEALATSLVDLIAERQHQRNFQLVVITHDEEFLSRLSHSDALTQYWRVSRDENLVRN